MKNEEEKISYESYLTTRTRLPKLSWLDHIVYIVLFVSVVALFMTVFLSLSSKSAAIAFADESVIAYDETVDMWIVVSAIPVLLLVWFAFVLLISYINKYPIFGRKGQKYGEPEWSPIYPILMNDKEMDKEIGILIRKRRKEILIWIIILVISLPGIHVWMIGRTCLHEDGSISVYNVKNERERYYAFGEIKDVIFGAYSGKKQSIYIKVRPVRGGSHRFDLLFFRREIDEEISVALEEMLYMKEVFEDKNIEYENIEYLWDVVENPKNGFGEEEKLLICELFNLPEDYFYVEDSGI